MIWNQQTWAPHPAPRSPDTTPLSLLPHVQNAGGIVPNWTDRIIGRR